MTDSDPVDPRQRILDDALAFVRRLCSLEARVGIILGSGLGAFADEVQKPDVIPFAEIPGFPAVSVTGHAGVLLAGHVRGVACIVMQGRYHRYEGHDAATTALPARLLVRLGVATLILTNAAGAIAGRLEPGDLMLIDDHINLMGFNPLTGPVLDGETRFPDMSAPWDLELQRIAESVAAHEGIRLERGVYCAVHGPNYETPAEVRMLERLGADVVGMSTVPEVLVARAAGVKVLGISLVTNAAAGRTGAPLTHDEVIAAGAAASRTLVRLLTGVLAALPART
ncbi:MAG: purine-nucleoside phosphorylase [Gemmatimonadetes bacterium]|nr:purine-nucleoside phosphorylase [Gemmatimonadota bacterium]